MKLIKQLIGKILSASVACLSVIVAGVAVVVLSILGIIVAPIVAFMIVRGSIDDEKEYKKFNRQY